MTFQQNESSPKPRTLVTPPSIKDQTQVELTEVTPTDAKQPHAHSIPVGSDSAVGAAQPSIYETRGPAASLDATRATCDPVDDDRCSPSPLSVIEEENSSPSSHNTTPDTDSKQPATQPISNLKSPSERSETGEAPLSIQVSTHSEVSLVSHESEPRGRTVQFHTRVITVSPSPASLASLDQLASSTPRPRRPGLARRGSAPLSPPSLDGTSDYDFE